MKKYLFIFLGIICVVLGLLGVFIPGLPTTPFLLLASWLFYRSSQRLHSWLHRSWLGKYLEKYQSKQGVGWKTKLVSILCMLTMITISTCFFIENPNVKIIVLIAGAMGVFSIVFFVPNEKRKSDKDN